MNVESIQTICDQMPPVTEEVKQGHDLAFFVGRMFYVAMEGIAL